MVWLTPRPGRFTPRNRPGTHCIGCLVWTGAGSTPPPTGIRSSDRTALYRLIYRDPYRIVGILIICRYHNIIRVIKSRKVKSMGHRARGTGKCKHRPICNLQIRGKSTQSAGHVFERGLTLPVALETRILMYIIENDVALWVFLNTSIGYRLLGRFSNCGNGLLASCLAVRRHGNNSVPDVRKF